MVVLPLVPVTPTTRSSRGRIAVEARRDRRHRRARRRRRRPRARRGRAGARRRAPRRRRSTASGAKSWPSAVLPGTQKKSVPGPTLAAVDRRASLISTLVARRSGDPCLRASRQRRRGARASLIARDSRNAAGDGEAADRRLTRSGRCRGTAARSWRSARTRAPRPRRRSSRRPAARRRSPRPAAAGRAAGAKPTNEATYWVSE